MLQGQGIFEITRKAHRPQKSQKHKEIAFLEQYYILQIEERPNL